MMIATLPSLLKVAASTQVRRVFYIPVGVGAQKYQLGETPCHFGDLLHPYGMAECDEDRSQGCNQPQQA